MNQGQVQMTNPFQELADTAVPKSLVEKLAGLCLATSSNAGWKTMCAHLDIHLGGRAEAYKTLASEILSERVDIKHFELRDFALEYLRSLKTRSGR